MTTWRPNEPVEENMLNLAGIDPQNNRRSRRRAWRVGLADQTVVGTLEDILLPSVRAHPCRQCRASIRARACARSSTSKPVVAASAG